MNDDTSRILGEERNLEQEKEGRIEIDNVKKIFEPIVDLGSFGFV